MVSERRVKDEIQMGNEEECACQISCFQLFIFSCLHIFPFLIFARWQSFYYSFSPLSSVLKVLILIFILSIVALTSLSLHFYINIKKLTATPSQKI